MKHSPKVSIGLLLNNEFFSFVTELGLEKYNIIANLKST